MTSPSALLALHPRPGMCLAPRNGPGHLFPPRCVLPAHPVHASHAAMSFVGVEGAVYVERWAV